MAPYHGWLYGQDPDGQLYEIINHARTAAYLKNPQLGLPGLDISNVLDFGGCEAYAYEPPCSGDPGHVDLPGVAGNYLSVPDSPALDLTGDMSLIVDVALDDWTPAVTQTLVAKWQNAGNLSYAFSVTTGGLLQFQWTTNGTAINTATSSRGLAALPPGERRSLRVDVDVSVPATQKAVTFYTAAAHDKPYVRLDQYLTGGTTSIFSGTSPLTIGGLTSSSQPVAGKIFYVQANGGISGTAVVGGFPAITIDMNVLTTLNQATFQALTGQIVTINRTGSPGVLIQLGPSAWQPVGYLTPAIDEAPWYDPARPESALAYGFFVEEWTGLGNAHIVRPVSRAGKYRSRLGALAAKERVMALTVLAIAASEQALEYLFQWLQVTLEESCTSCATSTVYFRRFCPPGSDKGVGVGEMRNVGLTIGVDWASDPFDAAGKCLLRRLTFTLTAGDPSVYVNGTTPAVEQQQAIAATCIANTLINTTRVPCRPSCSELNNACRDIWTFQVDPLGTAAPVVTLTNAATTYSMPVRAICYANPNELDPTGTATCGLPRLGEIYIDPLPPASTIVWDVAGRDVTYSDHTTAGFVSGWPFVNANDPPLSRFEFALPCGTGHVVVEPAYACLNLVDGHYYYGSVDLGIAPHFPTASVEIQERFGGA